MTYFADQTSGQYIGNFGTDQDAPANSVEVPSPPDFSVQVWENNQWMPVMDSDPNPVGLGIALGYLAANGLAPTEILEYMFVLQWQGTAQNSDLDSLHRAVFYQMINNPRNSGWLTPEFQATLIRLGAAYGVPFV